MGRNTTPTEHDEQVALVEWLELQRIRFFAIPNGELRPAQLDAKGRRYSNVAKRLRAEGVKAGVPDVIIVDPPPVAPDIRAVAIELKRRKGGTLSPDQQEWIAALNDRGWLAIRCDGAAAAIAALEDHGYGRRRSA